jgi:hypothetical protein
MPRRNPVERRVALLAAAVLAVAGEAPSPRSRLRRVLRPRRPATFVADALDVLA